MHTDPIDWWTAAEALYNATASTVLSQAAQATWTLTVQPFVTLCRWVWDNRWEHTWWHWLLILIAYYVFLVAHQNCWACRLGAWMAGCKAEKGSGLSRAQARWRGFWPLLPWPSWPSFIKPRPKVAPKTLPPNILDQPQILWPCWVYTRRDMWNWVHNGLLRAKQATSLGSVL